MKGFVILMMLSLGVALARGRLWRPATTVRRRGFSRARCPRPSRIQPRHCRKNAKNWPAAVGSFQKAVSLKPAFSRGVERAGFCSTQPGQLPGFAQGL